MPSLLLRGEGLVKTVRFEGPEYIGDPINAVRILNEKEVDGLTLFDITASLEGRSPRLELLSRIAGECFMPFCYGGGIRAMKDIEAVIKLGAEKVCINSYAVENPDFIKSAVEYFGSQSITVAIDAALGASGRYRIYTHSGTRLADLDLEEFVLRMEALGAGEIFVNSIDRDGTMRGYDIDLIKKVTDLVKVPVVACGGAGSVGDLAEAVRAGGASAVAAGSLFVFIGPHRAVLVNSPSSEEINSALCEQGSIG